MNLVRKNRERKNEASNLEYENYEDISEAIDNLKYEEECEREEG